MIDLIEILFNQHPFSSRIYLTWDAASWHKSGLLAEWLDAFNVVTTSSGLGPTIHLVPLPTSSQFLDVIEAVFSGMKKTCDPSFRLSVGRRNEEGDFKTFRGTERLLP